MYGKRNLAVLSCVLTLALVPAACHRSSSVEAAADNQPAVSPAGQDYMMKTARADLSDIDIARLAMKKSGNSDVRDYANMIQKDHSTALEDLSDLMKDKNVPVPEAATADARQDLSLMSTLSGAEFDREFINVMVADHQKAVDMSRDQLRIVQDPDLKKFIEDRLPQLEMHLEKAQRLQSRLFRTSR